jgi:hypothetical protein
MVRSEDYIMAELRKAQKALTAAKRRGGKENIAYQRARIAELRKEMETATGPSTGGESDVPPV